MKTVYIGGLDFSLIGRLYFNVNRELKQCALGSGVWGGGMLVCTSCGETNLAGLLQQEGTTPLITRLFYFLVFGGRKGPHASLIVLGAIYQIENPI